MNLEELKNIPPNLTVGEQKVYDLLSTDDRNYEILAWENKINKSTFAWTVRELYKKYKVSSRHEFIRKVLTKDKNA